MNRRASVGVCAFALSVDFGLGLKFLSGVRARHDSDLLKILHDGVSGLDGSKSALLALAREFEGAEYGDPRLLIGRALMQNLECAIDCTGG